MDNITSPQFLKTSLNQGGNSINFAPTQPQQTTSQNTQAQPVQTVTAKDGTVLDAGVVNLSKAIKQQESGGNYNAVGDNGTSHGAYQWQPGNFAKDATQFGLDPTDFSPVNQDKVAYAQINAYKQMGYSPSQIASLWNSGKPDPTGNAGVTEINGKPVSYDTPKYVASVMSYFNQNKAQSSQTPSQTQPTEGKPSGSPSLEGFLGNTIKSGANFVGNIGNAVLHPLQTAQNIGGAAVGAVQELGGQNNDNTAKFDNLKNYFVQRYGSVDNLLHTAYTDPVGLAGDLSAVLGVGGGIADIGAAGADAAGLGAKAIEAGGADFVGGAEGAGGAVQSTAGSGIAGGLQTAGETLGKGSELANPLTPVIKGAGALLNSSKNLSDIIANPQNYSPEDIANSASDKISSDVQNAFDAKQSTLSDTGSAYQPLRDTPASIKVSPDFLDNTLRDTLKLDVTDGVIKANSNSLIRNSADVSKLQNVYNTYKTDFLNDTMDSNKLLNLRTDLGNLAYNDLGIKNTTVASAAEDLRNSLNSAYREQVPGLSDLDSSYSSQKNSLNELKNGLITKTGANAGELKSSFISKALKAAKTGDTATLEQLEEVLPGITKRLQVNQTLKDLGSPSFTTSLIEKGGLGASILTGNVKGIAAAVSSIIISQPEIAVPLLRGIGANIDLVKGVMANLAKFSTLSAVGSSAVSTPQQNTEQPQQVDQTQGTISQPQLENQPQISSDSSSLNVNDNLEQLAQQKNFNLTAARKAGYSDQEISEFLNTQS